MEVCAMTDNLAFARSRRNTFLVGGETFRDREKAIIWARVNGYTYVTERAFRGMRARISSVTPTRRIEVS
jgi:hypothetical protein